MSKPTKQQVISLNPFSIFFKGKPKNSSKQTNHHSIIPQQPINDDPNVWGNYWQAQKPPQPWRTQPEIPPERQAELTHCLMIRPDIKHRIYPFKDMMLSRADIEWLLATHENGRGPVNWSDVSQRARPGLDLRGAILNGEDLSGLPLARMHGGLAKSEWANTTLEERELAAVHLENANLSKIHLEGADLGRARLKRAELKQAHLEGAYLRVARLEQSDLGEAHLEGADLTRAHLQHAYLRGAYLEGANLEEAHLEGASLREACLEGKNLRQNGEESSAILHPTNLRGAYFDNATNLEGIQLGNGEYGFVQLADVRWGDVNLTVVDWAKVNMLGDEYRARKMVKGHGEGKSKDEQLKQYHAAVRANRQLAVVLRDQGLHEEASHFAYHAQVLQRQVLLQRMLQQRNLQIIPLLIVFILLEILLRTTELKLGLSLLPLPPHPVSLLSLQLGISPLAVFPFLFFIIFPLLESLLPKLLQLETQNEQENMLPLPLALMGVLIILLFLTLISVILILLFLIFIVPFIYLLPAPQSILLSVGLLSIGLIYLLLLRKPLRWIAQPLLNGIPFASIQEHQQYIVVVFRMLFNAIVDYGKYSLLVFLDLLAGYGYKPGRSLIAYSLIISGFATAYFLLESMQKQPLTLLEAVVFSMASFHGRGFFPSNAISLGDPMVVLAAIEALVGLIIEISFIATFTQRFFGK